MILHLSNLFRVFLRRCILDQEFKKIGILIDIITEIPPSVLRQCLSRDDSTINNDLAFINHRGILHLISEIHVGIFFYFKHITEIMVEISKG